MDILRMKTPFPPDSHRDSPKRDGAGTLRLASCGRRKKPEKRVVLLRLKVVKNQFVLQMIRPSVFVIHKPVAACFLIVDECICSRIPPDRSFKFIGYIADATGNGGAAANLD